MAIQNPKVGGRVWIKRIGMLPEEGRITLLGGGINGLCYLAGRIMPDYSEELFPSLDELLSDLRARAVPITESNLTGQN